MLSPLPREVHQGQLDKSRRSGARPELDRMKLAQTIAKFGNPMDLPAMSVDPRTINPGFRPIESYQGGMFVDGLRQPFNPQGRNTMAEGLGTMMRQPENPAARDRYALARLRAAQQQGFVAPGMRLGKQTKNLAAHWRNVSKQMANAGMFNPPAQQQGLLDEMMRRAV